MMTPHALAPASTHAARSRCSWRACALGGLLFAAGVVLPSSAQASLSVAAIPGGQPSGGNARENFDGLLLGGAPGQVTPTGLTVNFTSGAGAVTGSMTGVYAAPVLSGGNGNGFGPGGTDQALGTNATTYLTTSNARDAFGWVELLLPGESTTFGLLWGSIEADNLLQLFDGATLVGEITGSGVAVTVDGSQTRYVNLQSTLAFDRVVLSSTAAAFEFDNVAFSAAVPLPGTLALGALGLWGVFGLRARRRV
ncbi:MAG: PEP-CTERM sorting domain-containing protein [Rubrivivax sp.]|jgi:hypothetical protein